MNTINRLKVGLLGAVALLALATAAFAGDAAGDGWRFDRGMGWRYEVRSGYWSPHYVWWWVGGRAVLGSDPVEHSVRHEGGSYELRGDGIEAPFYWQWVSSTVTPPPPLPPELLPSDAPKPPSPPRGAPPREIIEARGFAPEQERVFFERRAVAAEPVPRAVKREKAAGGTILGGAAGGLVGLATTRGKDRFAGILIGTLIGGLIGHEIGKNLDDADELRAMTALEKNKSGQRSTWVNPDSGAEISVVPERTYENREGEYCREYETEVVINGEVKKAYGTACRQPNGEWKVVK